MSAVETIHLIPHTHVDFGYTDLPSTIDRLQIDFTRAAARLVNETGHFDEPARFRWTVEVAEVAEIFLKQATAEDRAAFDAAIASGRMEIGAMPFNTTGLLGAEEWQELLRRLEPLHTQYRLRTCVQNDINGLPWGILPSLLDREVEFVSMGLNEFGGGTPMRRPRAFWWEGPDGRRVFTWLGMHYSEGYLLFHEKEWRRGPVPHSSDLFYRPPARGDTWFSDPKSLAASYEILKRRLQGDFADYPWKTLGAQVTNMWRVDNDPPCELTCEFVAAWNAAGYKPALRLSTFTDFLEVLREEAGATAPVVRGDWPDWWAEGVTSFPTEIASSRAAARLLREIPAAAGVLSSSFDFEPRRREAWRMVSRFTEHTFGSYNSVAEPHSPLAMGTLAEKSAYAFQAFEQAKCLLADVVRASALYRPRPGSRDVIVVNSDKAICSGWVRIPASSLRFEANALVSEDGKVYPLLKEDGPAWSVPDPSADRPFERPDDVWSFQTRSLKAFVSDLPGETPCRFRLEQRDLTETAPASEVGFAWKWDMKRGRLLSLRPRRRDVEYIDSAATFDPGQCIVDRFPEFGAREYLLRRDRDRVLRGRVRERAVVTHCATSTDTYSEHVTIVSQHHLIGRVQQQWINHRTLGRIEIETTFWINETFIPVMIALGFPFNFAKPNITYSSLASATRVGDDQIPNTCGEFQLIGDGVTMDHDDMRLRMWTPDAPMVAFGQLELGTRKVVSRPDNGHLYNIVCSTSWDTNFIHLRAGKLVVRNVIEEDTGHRALIDHFLAFPD